MTRLTIETSENEFVFAVCQIHSNDYCKREILEQFPDARLAFSRPGFLTFKFPHPISANQQLNSTFARTWGTAFRGQRGGDPQLIEWAADTANMLAVEQIHVFQRDRSTPGTHGFEPGISELASQVALQLKKHLASRPQPLHLNDQDKAQKRRFKMNQLCNEHDKVLDVIVVEPDHWWLGFHIADSIPQRWPGGVPLLKQTKVISRAYYKIAEALEWSQLPVRKNDLCVEIGSSPGGSCQYLLDLGARVIAIDPAELDPTIAEHPGVEHIRRRAHEVKRKWLAEGKWLFCDANISPREVLNTVEEWLDDGLNFRGMLLTMKIASDDWFDQLDEYRKRVQSWGFGYVKTRQLAFNRNEVCLMALKNRAIRRFG